MIHPSSRLAAVTGQLNVLEREIGPDNRCLGYASSKKRRCTQKLSQEKLKELPKTLTLLLITDHASILENLVHLLLCATHNRENDRKQLAKRLACALAKPDTDAPIKSEHEDTALQNIEELAPLVKHEAQDSPRIITSSKSDVVRPITEEEPGQEQVERIFKPFGTTKSVLKLNTAIKKSISRPFTQRELDNFHTPGYLYFYTHPSNSSYRHVIKIGFSEDTKRRLTQWQGRCKYVPKQNTQVYARHYMRVERLVHDQLYNQRLREPSCAACKHSHIELFTTRSWEAAPVAEIWAEWMAKEPYDFHGTLKKVWQKRLEEVDLNDKECWRKFVDQD